MNTLARTALRRLAPLALASLVLTGPAAAEGFGTSLFGLGLKAAPQILSAIFNRGDAKDSLPLENLQVAPAKVQGLINWSAELANLMEIPAPDSATTQLVTPGPEDESDEDETPLEIDTAETETKTVVENGAQ